MKNVSRVLRLNSMALMVGLALLRLLQNTAQAADAVTQFSDDVLDTVIITGTDLDQATLPGGQVGESAKVGILGRRKVIDTPMSVTSYTAELVKNQQAKNLGDFLTTDVSVRQATSSGHMYENFRIRGFNVNQNDIAINGMYGLAPIGHTPLEFIERVEVLKGASGLFSGMAPTGAVGGVINVQTKRAGDEDLTELGLNYQSNFRYGLNADIGRRFGAQKQWGVRFNGAYSDGETDVSGQKKKREFASVALDYRGESFRASLDAYHSKDRFKGGSSSMFWFTNGIAPAPDPSINQFPSAYGQLGTNAAILNGEYDFNEHISAFASVGVMRHDYSGFITDTIVRNANQYGTSTTTATYAGRGYTDSVAAQAGVRANFMTGYVKHEMVLHASHLDQEVGSKFVPSSAYTTNIYHPSYQALMPIPAAAAKTTENTLNSFALMDTLSFLDEKVQLTLGLRHQKVETTNFNSNTGAITAQYDKSAVTPAVAVVVKPWTNSVSLYANYIQSLSKGDTVTDSKATNYQHVFAPYKTEQKEIGVKWQIGSFFNTFAAFEISRPMMVAQGDSTTPTYSDAGEKRVRGIEWNTFGEITDTVRLFGGISYTKGKQVKTAYDLNNGKETVGAPHWQGNIGAEWDMPWVRGLTANGLLIATSKQYLNSANTVSIPGWAQLNLGLSYETTLGAYPTVFRLNVDNVFDRRYYSGVFSETTPIATLANGRSVSASISMRF